METKHTKGEWFAEGRTLYSLHTIRGEYDHTGEPRKINRFYAGFYPDYANGVTLEEVEANVKLCAAAPDMLSALIELHNVVMQTDDRRIFDNGKNAEVVAKAKEVIFKATGK